IGSSSVDEELGGIPATSRSHCPHFHCNSRQSHNSFLVTSHTRPVYLSFAVRSKQLPTELMTCGSSFQRLKMSARFHRLCTMRSRRSSSVASARVATAFACNHPRFLRLIFTS